MSKDNKMVEGFLEKTLMSDMIDQAEEAYKDAGVTDMYSTGFSAFDEWLGGGFGKKKSFESVVVMAAPGVGKTNLSMAMLKKAVESGTPQAWAMMEDDIPSAMAKFALQYDSFEEARAAMGISQVHFLSQRFMDSEYTLDDIFKWFEFQYTEYGIRLFLLDNLQYCFDNANSSTRGNNDIYIIQRNFMKKLNILSKKHGLTFILVSHTNFKDKSLRGMAKVQGSSAIVQISTKVIEIEKDPTDNSIVLRMSKNRHAPVSYRPLVGEMDGIKFTNFYISDEEYL